MTGLDIERDKILELACIITDANLNIISEESHIVINHPENVLNSMNEWCIKQHGKTGLIKDSLNSQITIEEAEKQLMEFLKKYVPPSTCPLAGNSVYMDRLFLRKFMSKIDEYLHYRIIDVSTIKELCKRWNPGVFANSPKKCTSHRALEDIKDSIVELKYYRDHFFKIINTNKKIVYSNINS